MVDAEFAVQYLVLAHAARHPQLLDNVGNIALLMHAQEVGLLPQPIGSQAADAYRELRHRQHQARLDAHDGREPLEDWIAPRQAILALWQAALGADIEVPTMSGRSTVRMPSGTQHGTVFRLRGKGVQHIQGHGVGDLLVRVQIDVPTKLTTEQRAKLVEFAELCKDDNVHDDATGFFSKAKGFFKKGE